MKILIFSTAYFPHVGGAEVAVKEIVSRVKDAEFSMITVRLDKKDTAQEKMGNIIVYRVGWEIGRIDKLLFPFRAARLANKLHRQEKYDIAWSIMASFSGFAALFFKKKNPEIKFLLTLQEGDDLKQVERKVWLVKPWFKQIFTKADYIQCISSYLADWAKNMGATCAIDVVPNGVNRVSSIKYQVSSIRKDLGIGKNNKVIVTASRLVEKNGLGDLVKSVKILDGKYQMSSTLIICGIGELENELKELAKNLKVEDKVKFAGFVEPNELPKYYAAADVFCRPSLTEGLGNSFLEAMAHGVPVIATPVGGIPDFLEDGKTGWFCEVRNPESIAEKIKYILDDKNEDEVAQVVNSAKQMVLEKYNWGGIAEKMDNVFNKLIK